MSTAVLGLALVMSPLAWGATITVDGKGAGDFRDIQEGLDAATDGDVVLVAAGEYVIDEQLVLRGRITLHSERGPSRTTVRLSDLRPDEERASVIALQGKGDASPVLDGFTLTGGRGNSEYWGLCEVLDCVGTTMPRGGGILCLEGIVSEIRNCIITKNRAQFGGGVFCHRSSVRFTNCVIAANSGSNGAAFYGAWGSAAYFDNCTIVVTEAVPMGFFPGGVIPGRPMLLNCIFIMGGSGYGVGPRSHCLGGDPAALFLDPDHGDFRLRPGSPAIDFGASEGAPATDIEGHGRPCGGGVDAGAFESGDCPSPEERFVRGDADLDGAVGLSDAQVILSYLFLGASELACAKSGDLDDNGSVDLTDAVLLLVHLFLGGKTPAEPFPSCGIDPTLDSLPCGFPVACGH